MSIIQMPTGLYITSAEWRNPRYDITENSDVTGSTASRIFGPPKWGLSISCDTLASEDQSAEWESMALSLEGETNRLAAYDPRRRVPRGTMRGVITLGAAVAKYDRTIQLSGPAGTLLTGDMLQVGSGLGTSMLFKIMAPVTSSGSVVASVYPASRYAFAAGTPVTWDHPRMYAKLVTKQVSWRYEPGTNLMGGHALELLEAFN